MTDWGSQIHTVGDGSGIEHDERFFREELALAFRNRGMPLEAMRYPVTPAGMHYLLTHFDMPSVDAGEWRLRMGGEVASQLSLSLASIQQRPARTLAVTLECAGNGRALMHPRPVSQPWLGEAIGTVEWTGTPLKGLIQEAGLRDGVREILFTGLDRGIQGGEVQHYQRSLSVEEACREEVLLVWAMNGQPLPPQHGFPLRLIVPGWYGMTSVKWLDCIEAIREPFDGYQMQSYRYRDSADDPGRPVQLQRVRALMIPPGIPDFLTRTRVVEPGSVKLKGRAWAGRAEVRRVEVSVDGGDSWGEAALGNRVSPHGWHEWSFDWEASPGRCTLCVRATDDAGNVQPIDTPWNHHGMGNNVIQRVEVIVGELD